MSGVAVIRTKLARFLGGDYHPDMAMIPSSSIILYADQEHERLRTAVIFVVIITILLGYQIMRSIFALAGNASDYIYILSCVGGLPIGLALSWFIEQGLKRVWPSGNSITLNENSLELQTNDGYQQMVEWDHHIVVTNWYFQLSGYMRGGRERRIPNKWLCLASQLRQEEERVIIFTYLSPTKAADWLADTKSNIAFHEIKASDIYTSKLRDRFSLPARPEIPKEILAGKDGIFWLAERRRWQEGVELTPQDFGTYLGYLKRKA